MTNLEKINKVVAWQNNQMVHPLTCTNSQHGALDVKEHKEEVILVCVECGYTQTYIPEVVLKG